jgi:hypothetical protein
MQTLYFVDKMDFKFVHIEYLNGGISAPGWFYFIFEFISFIIFSDALKSFKVLQFF